VKRLDIKPVLVGMILVLAANPAFAQDLSQVSNMIDNIITAVSGQI
jgi:type IV secretion system protein VirB2